MLEAHAITITITLVNFFMYVRTVDQKQKILLEWSYHEHGKRPVHWVSAHQVEIEDLEKRALDDCTWETMVFTHTFER